MTDPGPNRDGPPEVPPAKQVARGVYAMLPDEWLELAPDGPDEDAAPDDDAG